MRHTRSRSANALFLSMFTVALLSSFAAIALQFTSSQARFGRRSQEMNTAYAVADGVSELLFHRWRAKMRSDSDKQWNVNDLLTAGVTNVTLADVGVDSSESFRIDRITLKHVDIYGRPQPDNANIKDALGKQPKDGPEPGKPYYRGAVPGTNSFIGFNLIYEARIWVSSTLNESSGNPIQVGVKRYFTKSISPPLQAAIFYNDQLELHPGSDMTINGLVHTNSSFYACGMIDSVTGVPSVLTFNEAVSYSGNWGSVSKADEKSVNPTEPVYNAGKPARVDRMSIGGVDPDSLNADNTPKTDPITGKKIPPNYNDDSYRELVERPVRKADVTMPADLSTVSYEALYDDPASIKTQRAYNRASLKILLKYLPSGSLDLSPTGCRVYGKTPDGKADGPNLRNESWVGELLTVINNGQVGNARTKIRDQRENTDVQVTTVNVANLKGFLDRNMGPRKPNRFNGVLYISDITNDITALDNDGSYMDKLDTSDTTNYLDAEHDVITGKMVKHAIMLTDGEKLPTASFDATDDTNDDGAYFTVATDNPVYVKGDYNTGDKGDKVPSNVAAQSTNPKTTAPNYESVQAAILADTVTAVSSKFKPENSAMGLWDTEDGNDVLVRGADSTTVNAAVVCGYTQSVDSGPKLSSSGGAQNLIRLTENWAQDASKDGQKVLRNFTYNGSLMQAFLSKQFSGIWSDKKGFYNNPNRRVDFDSSFTNRPPRGAPETIIYARGKWERLTEALP